MTRRKQCSDPPHYWTIGAANGSGKAWGACRKCRARRLFKVSQDHYEFNGSVESARNGGGKSPNNDLFGAPPSLNVF
jgi:hypothetical protein